MDARILVVDDSAFMRKIISNQIAAIEGLMVVGTARNGEDALRKTELLQPDALTLDVSMPGMDGIETVQRLRQRHSMPIFMLSSLTDQQTTMEALEAGATDFLEKPQNLLEEPHAFQKELAEKVLSVLQARRPEKPNPASLTSESSLVSRRPGREKAAAVVIGASTGGPGVLMQLVRSLPKGLAVPVFIVQHMPVGFTASFAGRLNANAKVPVREAKDGETILAGHVYVAPGDFHMQIEGRVIRLSQTDKVHGVRPAVDLLFESAAKTYGANTIAIVLTGMGKDGTQGLRAVKAAGGRTIVQEEASCVVYGMPGSAMKAGVVDQCASIPKLCHLLQEGVKVQDDTTI